MFTQDNQADPAVDRARLSRSDLRTRDLVNLALVSVPTLGVQRAAAFLAAMHVPAEIAVRCLCNPRRRRPA